MGSVSDAGLTEPVETAHVIVANALPEALGRAAREVRLIHAGGAGVNRIHMDSVPAGVPLCRTLHHGPSMAEHVLMVILALQRDLFGLDRDLRAGRWRNAAYDPRDALQSTLDGKTVVVLGAGGEGKSGVIETLTSDGTPLVQLRSTKGGGTVWTIDREKKAVIMLGHNDRDSGLFMEVPGRRIPLAVPVRRKGKDLKEMPKNAPEKEAPKAGKSK